MITESHIIETNIDLDTNDIEVLQQKLDDILERCISVQALWYRVSSRKGYHIKIVHEQYITLMEHFQIRATFGDDEARIRLDLERLYNNIARFNILWDGKDVLTDSAQTSHQVGPWLRYDIIPEPVITTHNSIIREIYRFNWRNDQYGR